MPVAEPIFNSKELLEKATSQAPRFDLERRLLNRLQSLIKQMNEYTSHIKAYQTELDKRKAAIEGFQAEIDNCMTEEDVRQLCNRSGA